MNEIIPPAEPDPPLPQLPPVWKEPKKEPPRKGLNAFLGFLLLILSIGLAFVFPLALLVGLAAAIASLFFEGYRYIFIGYILTLLIGGGLFLLAAIVICGNSSNSFR